MIKPRTIILSLTAVTLSACAHATLQSGAVSRQDTASYALSAAQDHQDQRMAQLDNEIFHLSTAFAARKISEDAFAARLAAIEAERASLSAADSESTPARQQTQISHSARSAVSLL